MPDPIPFRTLCMTALTDALSEITPANGYHNDLSVFPSPVDGQPQRRVFRGRAFFGDDDPLPMVAVLERPEEGEALAQDHSHSPKTPFDWGLLVQGFVDDTGTDPTDKAYLLLADVRHCLEVERLRKSGAAGRRNQADPLGLGIGRGTNHIEKLSYGAGIVRPADEISAKAYFWLGVTLRIVEDPLLPFA